MGRPGWFRTCSPFHLQEVPLLGGEMAVKDPRRLVFAISELLGQETSLFDEREAEVLRKTMKKSTRTNVVREGPRCIGL